MQRWLAVWGIALALACQSTPWTVPDDAEPSEGCGVGGVPTSVTIETIEVEGVTREYRLWVTSEYDEDYPFPLVMLFHGAGGSGSEFREYAGLEQAAGGRALFVYPDALLDSNGVSRWSEVDIALFVAVRDRIAASHCLDQRRVFAAGFSNGALLANELGCSLGPELTGIAAVAGGGPEGVCTGSVAAWLGHGTADPVVPVAAGRASRDSWIEQNGCTARAEPVAGGPCVGHVDCEQPVVWCEHDRPASLAHSWPDFVADAMWEFFADLP